MDAQDAVRAIEAYLAAGFGRSTVPARYENAVEAAAVLRTFVYHAQVGVPTVDGKCPACGGTATLILERGKVKCAFGGCPSPWRAAAILEGGVPATPDPQRGLVREGGYQVEWEARSDGHLEVRFTRHGETFAVTRGPG